MRTPSRRPLKFAAILATLILTSTLLLYAATGVITNFGFPGATAIGSVVINSSGTVAGRWTDMNTRRHGFSRTLSGAMTSVNEPGAGTELGHGTSLYGINDLGEIVGYYTCTNASPVIYCGFSRDASGTYTSWVVPGALSTFGLDINNSGVIIGVYSPDDAHEPAFVRDAAGTITKFSVNNAQYTTAVSINSSSQVTGYYIGSDGNDHGFIRNPAGTILTFDVPNAASTSPEKISSNGLVTGYEVGSVLPYVARGFLRDASGSITAFDAPGAGAGDSQGTFPFGINASGTIVGYYLDSNSVHHGFIRNADGSFVTVDDTNAGSGPNQGTSALSINRLGQIGGTFTRADGTVGGFIRK